MGCNLHMDGGDVIGARKLIRCVAKHSLASVCKTRGNAGVSRSSSGMRCTGGSRCTSGMVCGHWDNC